MFNIGIIELVIIFCIAIIFLSPQDMLKIIRIIKNFKAKISNLYSNSQSLVQELTDLVDEKEIKKVWHQDLPQTKEYLDKIFQHELALKQKAKPLETKTANKLLEADFLEKVSVEANTDLKDKN